ncbi:MAG: CHASE2 domain-containing protein, partial [Alphaproteobacteria bacterium]|nr:CHASE2 domain-containing protein [Alphaproteobacteria bacterium]
MTPSPDIVVVTVSEDTVKRFAYRSPVDRAFLADVVDDLLAKGAKRIALDILFDQPTTPDKDARLARTLITAGNRVVIADAPEGRRLIYDGVPVARANLVKDAWDGTVRRIYTGQGGAPGLAVAVSGGPGADGPVLIYPPSDTALRALFPTFEAHSASRLPAGWFSGKTVLVGAELDQTD